MSSASAREGASTWMVRIVSALVAGAFALTGGSAALAEGLPEEPGDGGVGETEPSATAPDVVTDLVCELTETGIDASWAAVADAVDYEVTVLDGDTTVATADVEETSYSVTPLTPGNTYEVGVAARNEAGASEIVWCDGLLVDGVPLAPTGLVATAAAGAVSLAWTAPAATGVSAPLSYEVTVSADGVALPTQPAPVAADTTNLLVSGLIVGVEYTFQVRAANPIGSGPWSEAAVATPFGVAGAPTIVSTEVGASSITLTWSAPSSDGGADLSGYIVQYRSASESSWTTASSSVSASETRYTITGLSNGQKYDVRVLAVNEAGTSAASASASATTWAAASQPRSVKVSPGNGVIAVAWTAPSTDGGTDLTSYAVQVSTDGRNWRTYTIKPSVTSYRITGRTNGTKYYVRVLAKNAVGNGAWSSTVSATPRTAPSAPRSVKVSPGKNAIAVSWSAPSSSGGATRTAYIVQYRSVNATTWKTASSKVKPSATSYRITGLTNGTRYYVRVIAVNVAGSSTPSAKVSTVPRTVPSAPKPKAASAGSGKVKVSWSAPSNGGATITGYVVQRYSSGAWRTVATVGASARSATISGLTNGVSYSFRVVAKNAAGTGASSATVKATPKKPASSGGSSGSGCDPNYSGACVPIAPDVDCAGGSGNGPKYVRGPVRVIGNDIYDLDSDNDGWGCEG